MDRDPISCRCAYNRADVNVCDQLFWTPLHHAANGGHGEIVQLLVEAGATLDAPALNGSTPLMKAIENSHLACVDLLIKAGASVKAERKGLQNIPTPISCRFVFFCFCLFLYHCKLCTS